MQRPGNRAIALAVLTLAPATLGGPASAQARVHSFEGSCSLQGTVHFSPPATNAQQSLAVRYDAGGTCSGSLDGRAISNAAVSAQNAARDVDGSCLRADTTRPGSGWIAFPNGTVVRFTSEFHFVGTHGTFSLRGQRSGSAHGLGSFVTSRTPPDLALQCAGAGARSAPLDLTLATDSPLSSGAPAASTFSGSCDLSGAVTFHPPLTNAPHAVRQRARARGTCSGTFIDRRGATHQLSDARASFRETSHGDNASCAAGTAVGRGDLRLRYGRLRFAFSETRAGGTVIGSAEGRRSGSARGVGGVSQSEDPAAIAERCAGSGLRRVRIDVHLVTTPSISG